MRVNSSIMQSKFRLIKRKGYNNNYSKIDTKFTKRIFIFLSILFIIFGLTLEKTFSQTISTANFQGSDKTIIFIISETPLKNQREQQTQNSKIFSTSLKNLTNSKDLENSLKNRERPNDSKVFSIPLKNRTEFFNKFSKIFVSFNPSFLEKLQDKLNIETINITCNLYSLISQMNVYPNFDTKVLLEKEKINNIDLVDLDEKDIRLSKIEKYLINNKHSLENIKDFILELKIETKNDYSTSRNYLVNVLN